MVKPPVDLSIAVRKHHDPQVESQVCVICPRRKGKPQEGQSGASPVALSLEFLRPLFKKPLTQVSEELGLSATAIKKACRRFGVPKWPFRTLTAKTSRNRASFDSPPPRNTQISMGGAFSPMQAKGAQLPAMPKIEAFEALAAATRDNEDLKKLKEDAEMIKEVAALAEAREAGKKSPSSSAATAKNLDDQELSAARNLSLLSASVGDAASGPRMDVGELQMQYIRAWQHQQAALADGTLPKLAFGEVLAKGEGLDGVPHLPSMGNLLLPSPNPLMFSGLQGGPLMQMQLPLMGGAPMGMAVPVQMLVPVTALPAGAMQISA